MPSSKLIRWSGLATIGAGILLPVAWILTFAARSETTSLGLIGLWLLFLTHPFIMFALMGIYALQHNELGVIGLVGFVFASIGNLIVAGLVMGVNTPFALSVAVLGPSGNIGLALGFMLLGWQAWVADKLPRWTIPAWSIGMLVTVFGAVLTQLQGVVSVVGVIGAIIFGVGFIGSGLKLRTGNRSS